MQLIFRASGISCRKVLQNAMRSSPTYAPLRWAKRIAAALVLFWVCPAPAETPKGRAELPLIPTPTDPSQVRPSIQKEMNAIFKIKRLRDGSVRFIHPGFVVDVRPDGSLRMKDKSTRWSWKDLGFSFDISDSIMRRKGEDPYASDKLKLLEATLSWRQGLRRRWKRRLVDAYLDGLPRRLDAILKKPGMQPVEKRRILFLLWDECNEPDGTEMGKLGKLARDIILAFIRKRLPPAGGMAYTADELSRLNRSRESRDTFNPYLASRPLRREPRSRPPGRARPANP